MCTRQTAATRLLPWAQRDIILKLNLFCQIASGKDETIYISNNGAWVPVSFQIGMQSKEAYYFNL